MANTLLAPAVSAGRPTTQVVGDSGWRAGLRDARPLAGVTVVLAVTFGVLAREAGLSPLATVAMSALMFAGSAQFAVIGIVGGGGSIAAAVASTAMLNMRFLPMGLALGPSLPGRWPIRAVQGQAVIDASWAMAARENGRFDRFYLFANTGLQYVAWVTGSAIGSFAPHVDIEALGLDVMFPTVFMALLLGELRGRRRILVASLGALIALASTPLLPAGLPLLAASGAGLIGCHLRPGRPS